MANQSTSLHTTDVLTIIELEERFEMTAAAVDTAKCEGNTVTVVVDASIA